MIYVIQNRRRENKSRTNYYTVQLHATSVATEVLPILAIITDSDMVLGTSDCDVLSKPIIPAAHLHYGPITALSGTHILSRNPQHSAPRIQAPMLPF
jgi:hypothetical protein